MISYEHLHEVEHVELLSPARRPVSELLPAFEGLGFTIHDDVVTLDRTGKIPPWQSSTIVAVHVQCDGEDVYGFDEGEWNVIQLRYLFASLPYELSEKFVDVAFNVSKNLFTPVVYKGAEIDAEGLRARFAQVRADLLARTREDAGSEALAILIHSTYPRR
jgi:hypothetical protein